MGKDSDVEYNKWKANRDFERDHAFDRWYDRNEQEKLQRGIRGQSSLSDAVAGGVVSLALTIVLGSAKLLLMGLYRLGEALTNTEPQPTITKSRSERESGVAGVHWHAGLQTVQIPNPIYSEMVTHAREGFPNIVCGVVLGSRGKMLELYRAANIATDPMFVYAMEAKDQLGIWEQAEAKHLDVVVIYHSGPPWSDLYPSRLDITKWFYPEAILIILAIGAAETKYQSLMRDPDVRPSLASELGDPLTMQPRIRAFRIVKVDKFDKDGLVEEISVSVDSTTLKKSPPGT